MEIIDTDSSETIGTTIFESTLEDMEDKIVEENTGIAGVMIIIEVGIDQDVTNTILYLPQVHWGYHQTLNWSQLAMGLEKGISKMPPWGLSM